MNQNVGKETRFAKAGMEVKNSLHQNSGCYNVNFTSIHLSSNEDIGTWIADVLTK